MSCYSSVLTPRSFKVSSQLLLWLTATSRKSSAHPIIPSSTGTPLPTPHSPRPPRPTPKWKGVNSWPPSFPAFRSSLVHRTTALLLLPVPLSDPPLDSPWFLFLPQSDETLALSSPPWETRLLSQLQLQPRTTKFMKLVLSHGRCPTFRLTFQIACRRGCHLRPRPRLTRDVPPPALLSVFLFL